MCAKAIDLSILHDDDAVCILYAGDTLRDDQLCRIWYALAEGTPDICVSSRVYGARTVIEDQDLWLFQERAGNTKPVSYTHLDVYKRQEDSEAIRALVEVLKSQEIQDFINETYDGAVIPFVESADAEAETEGAQTEAAETETAAE